MKSAKLYMKSAYLMPPQKSSCRMGIFFKKFLGFMFVSKVKSCKMDILIVIHLLTKYCINIMSYHINLIIRW